MKFVHITSLKDTASTLPPAVTRQLLEATVAWVNQRKQAGKLLEIYAMAGWRRTMAISFEATCEDVPVWPSEQKQDKAPTTKLS